MNLADRWSVAMDPASYVAQMTMNQDVFQRRIEESNVTSAERAAFEGAPLRFLVITEDFCGDSAQFIPPLIRLAQELENVDVALLLRPEHQDLADGYRRPDGYQAIPVLIALDEAGDEIGHLIERPVRASAAMAAETRRFAQANPQLEGVSRTYDRMPDATKAAIRAHINAYRDERQAEWTRWLFEDLRDLIDDRRAVSEDAAG